jgi:tRNA modification GTPase
MANDAIVAIATAPGRGAIGVVRVSGPHLAPFLQALVNKVVIARHATRADFRNADGGLIDQGLVLYFPAPHSYTGEDVIELQGHGGPVVMQLLVARCVELGARLAEPGEFTKRAFLNDKLDLAQAESVADLIDATTAEAARCALRSLQGDFSRQIDAMVSDLVGLRILVEATLDFPEEELDVLDNSNTQGKLAAVREQLAHVIETSRRGSLLRDGIHVVLAGQPNVGKSSLMNRLAGSARAIVTDIPGTTRDAIRETIAIQGIPLHLIDTAGLREPQDEVETIGISRTWEAISEADLVLWVSDMTRPETHDIDPTLAGRLSLGVRYLHVLNKCDLMPPSSGGSQADRVSKVHISALTGVGIEQLRNSVLDIMGWSGGSETTFMARARHMQALKSAQNHLDAALLCVGRLELFAEELTLAQRALSSITGEFTADDLLGEIFSRFCIGK